MAQRYEYQDIEGHIILLFVHPAENYQNFKDNTKNELAISGSKSAQFVVVAKLQLLLSVKRTSVSYNAVSGYR